MTVRTISTWIACAALIASAVVLVGVARTPDAAATVILVTTATDVVGDDGDCSLREAIVAANSDTASGVSAGECEAGVGSDIIWLPDAATLTLTGGELPEVTSFISFIGSGATIDADGSGRVFKAGASAKLDIDNLTLTGGISSVGGAIFVDGGILNLSRSTVTGNSASLFGGAITNVDGIANIINSTLSGNSSSSTGGAIHNSGGTVSVLFSTLTDNSANDGSAISSDGASDTTTQIAASIVADNSGLGNDLDLASGTGTTDSFASGSFNLLGSIGANISAFGAATGDFTGQSGVGLSPLAVNAGGSTMTHALLTGSPAFNLVTAEPTFGFVQTADQNNTARPIGVAKDAGAIEQLNPCESPLAVSDETTLDFAITCYNSMGAGALAANVTAAVTYTGAVTQIDNSTAATFTIDGAGFTLDADSNGSVLRIAEGHLTIDNITLTGGTATSGGGIENNGGNVTVTNSTIEGNQASVFGGGATNLDGTLTLINSTVSGNDSDTGGGIANLDGTVTLVHTTVTDNSAVLGSGLSSLGGSPTLTELAGSLVVDNSGAGDDLELDAGSTDTFVSGSFNVLGTLGANIAVFGPATGDVIGQSNLGLLPLAVNAGGATATHALTAGSMAIDRVTGPLTIGSEQVVDQNGTSRPQGDNKDSGAFEASGLAAALCDGQLVTINLSTNGGNGNGTALADVILGTAAADLIRSLGGDDTICAGDGDDIIRSGAGEDTVYGEGGQDVIRSGGGSDTVEGGDDNDTIQGGGGSDTIAGGGGDDDIDGQGAADEIDGGDDNDTVDGQNGADNITGGAGNDELRGQTGPDIFDGESGDDDLKGGQGADTLTGGPDIDVCAGNTGPDLASTATCESAPGVENFF